MVLNFLLQVFIKFDRNVERKLSIPEHFVHRMCVCVYVFCMDENMDPISSFILRHVKSEYTYG